MLFIKVSGTGLSLLDYYMLFIKVSGAGLSLLDYYMLFRLAGQGLVY